MILTTKEQIAMLKNLISPKSSANTTKSVPNWATVCLSTNIDTIIAREVVSKKDSKTYTILEGVSNVGNVQLTADEAVKCLTTKATKVIWKRGKETEANSGEYYINLIIGDKPVGKGVDTPPVEKVEQDGNK